MIMRNYGRWMPQADQNAAMRAVAMFSDAANHNGAGKNAPTNRQCHWSVIPAEPGKTGGIEENK
ncbi:hypothetical protein [Burkholderia guangdongensis]|uniref:hypothetical protein n=1 Tax=Burkholderia guangdongensis TaxID=1792500 RepID=UPI0015C8654C|nr:hypothetical protein [Burkholderia guangdongensis]